MSELHFQNGLWIGKFHCMASPCELLVDVDEQLAAEGFLHLVEKEARRIETKFSRYRDDNIVAEINSAEGAYVNVDEETALLLSFAEQCHELSGGLFDITSGVLRKVWTFDGGDQIPTRNDIAALLPAIGWNRVTWDSPRLRLPSEMQIDLGGIGKEYAVDRAFERLIRVTKAPFLINFGGDLRVNGAMKNGRPWYVGVENPLTLGGDAKAGIAISDGALATSGDSRRFLLKKGKRYSHILNPLTGWPVADAPRSVTVAGPTTIEAGLMATLASLQGADAESFLKDENVKHWIVR